MSKPITVSGVSGKPCLTTGHRLYAIGSQDGLFPETGEHMAKEMWGVWAPPIKVMDGFWLKLGEEWLQKAEEFTIMPYGCQFTYDGEIEVIRFQFAPQEEKALVLKVTLKNNSSENRETSLTLAVKSELMPVWLSEHLGIQDGIDSARLEANAVFVKDAQNPWSLWVNASLPFAFSQQGEELLPQGKTQGKGAFFTMSSPVTLKAGESREVVYCFAASELSPEEAEACLHRVTETHRVLLAEKVQFFEELEEKAELKFPAQPEIEECYRWTQYANDWIVREVDRVGKGVVAGYAEFPWWFGHDTTFILPSLLMQGDYDTAKSTLRLIKEASQRANGNGRVVHEISNNGVVFYEGMSTETPQFADVVLETYHWTGDRDFLQEMYPFCVQGANYMDSISVDGLPTGYGITEIAELNCLVCDTAIYAARGYQAVAEMAKILGDAQGEEKFTAWMERTLTAFHKEFWMEELGAYGDMVATREEITDRATGWQKTMRGFPITDTDEIEGYASCKTDKSPEDAAAKQRLNERMQGIIRVAETMQPGERRAFCPFETGHSVFAVEYGFCDQEKSKQILAGSNSDFRPSEALGGNIMPIGTGHRIIAEYRAGNAWNILTGMQLVADSFGRVMPGATSEIYPDTGCFVQAWNSYATMWPIARCVFGLDPDAANKKLWVNPCLCEEMRGVELNNVIIGGQRFGFRVTEELRVEVQAPDGWEIVGKIKF